MTDILLAGRATIDKCVGDAIITFWNAPVDDPQHATNAADTALAMSARLRELNLEMPHQQKYPWPGEVRIGTGLNSGVVCVGNMGSERRLNYSMIGDTVNLASRIEGLTKFYGVEIALGGNLAERLPSYAVIQLDLVQVVGRVQPERVFALLGGPEVKTTRTFTEFAKQWEAFYLSYRAGTWEEARARLENVDPERRWQTAKPKAVYFDRIYQMEDAPPPSDWDGVYIARVT